MDDFAKLTYTDHLGIWREVQGPVKVKSLENGSLYIYHDFDPEDGQFKTVTVEAPGDWHNVVATNPKS